MYKELLKKVKQAKNCFAYVLLNSDVGGEYIYVSKTQVKHIINTTEIEIDLDKFVLRDNGDLYIN
jgi:hypothetical protein